MIHTPNNLTAYAVRIACLLTALAFVRNSQAFECTVTAVTCGALNGPSGIASWEAGLCAVADVTKIGSMNDKEYFRATLFVGARWGGDTIVLGGGSAKLGLMVTCQLPIDPKTKKPNVAKLKSELPALLMSDPAVTTRFPGVKQVEIEKALQFVEVPTAEAEKLFSSPDYKHHPR